MLEGFPLISRFTMPFSDVDMMRHVNNVSYIRWCEAIRAEYFAEVMKEPINGERGMIQANIQFTYERELHYREAVAIGIRVSRVGTKSWDFAYEIWSESDGVRVAHGTTTVVAYDFINRATIVIPQQWRDDIARYEAGPQRTYV